MPRVDINAQAAKIFKPVEVTVDGKDYDIEKIESHVLESLVSASKPRDMREAIADLCGVKADAFKHTDTRVLTLVVRQITKETKEQLDELDSKNVPGGNAKQKV